MQANIQELSEKARPVFEKYGLARVRLFGSFARGEAKPNSDIDLLVEFSRPLGFEYMNMVDELKELLGREVDVVREGSMNKFFRPYIMPDLVPLYEKR